VSERLFAFRWDVDHRVCMTDGVPRIRALCRDLDVRNTFFVNMGRSTNLLEWVRGARRTRAKLLDRQAIHLVRKTGRARLVAEAVLARPVGLSFVPQLRELAGDGHELGLHGGMDHVAWSRRFAEIPEERLAADVERSYGEFRGAFGEPAGFASPGFRCDGRVARLLDRLGFAYDGDAIGGHPRRNGRHWTIPVTLCGPGTIPYLENHAARGTAEAEVLRGVEAHLEGRDLAVMYGHPCWEGVHAELLRRVFETVLARGFRFATLAEIAGRLA
jgi:peptidoglycan/xylan/chitin deacetylase (PgdA/CDA1 family)